MKVAQEDLDAEIQLAQVVETAAQGTDCPVGVFYLCGKDHFEVAATFGCTPEDAMAVSGLAALRAAKQQPDGLAILQEVPREYGVRVGRPWLFNAITGPPRFLAAAHVAYEQNPVCGLLVVADTVPHAGLSMVQRYMLRTNAAQITAMLEFHAHSKTGQQRNSPTRRGSDIRGRLLDSSGGRVSDAIMVTKTETEGAISHRIVFCNRAFSQLTGYGEAELLNLSPAALRSDKTSSEALANLQKALLHRTTVAVELMLHRKDGTEFLADVRVIPAADRDGDFIRWFVVPRDPGNRGIIEEYRQRARLAEAENIMLEHEKASLEAEIQERKRIEARLNYVAFHDNLTSLYNRQFFIDRLAAAYDRLTHDISFRFAVLLLDLDRFKQINDSFGHRAGDLMLVEIAERLRNCTRADDVVARLGGDEFALLIEGFDKPGYVSTVAERVVEVVRYPVQIGAQEVFSSASIGAAYGTKYYRVPEEILRDADIAMYEAKRRRNGFLVFDDSMQRTAVVSSQLRTELQRALARSEFYVEYQPIFNLITKEVRGLEALIRWQHPTRGKLLPGAFISVAEEMGLIRQIGAQVLREACRQMQEWLEDYPTLNLQLSVNISGHELTDIRFIPQLDEVLADTGLPPAVLQLEVTESVLFPSSEPIVTVLNNAKSLGVRFALDDFGTGYSSLGYLDRYPIDAIKIDQSFVAGIPNRQRTISIVKAIIDLAAALNLEVTAEGIEQDSQMQGLLSMGCAQAQGFLLSKPLSADAVGKMLRKRAGLGGRH